MYLVFPMEINIWKFISWEECGLKTGFKGLKSGNISCEDILRLINNLVKLFMVDGCLWMLIDS